MGNTKHLEILKQGVDVWNKWRRENPEVTPDLSETIIGRFNLREANLSKANLKTIDLTEAYLASADLSSADLSFAFLIGADLSGANLKETVLYEANLHASHLRGAELVFTDLRESILIGADFSASLLINTDVTGATAGGTIFADLDMSEVKGLDKLRHVAPSSIGVDTIFRSGGKIPKTFLRAIGVPESLIECIESFTKSEYKFYSCFISHSSNDREFAKRLYDDLLSNRVRCWYAPEDMKIGDRIRQKIDQSIKIHDRLLLILSENSIDSEWVEDEVESAYEQERKRIETVLFPVRIDDAVIKTDKAWAAKLRRSRHIGDFTNWKDHDSYKKAFNRLLRDLKPEGQ